ncbi:MAG TPA: methyltransferase domain-containing protein [Casimicrobiaceae bacterium]|nr:methyltransferase domain-containing protein [Casimicrobiaceae bacterium]
MAIEQGVSAHYSRGELRERLFAALVEDGADPHRPTLGALAPYDQFHGGGLDATVAMADALAIRADDHILDVGSGIGGPARYFADRFGCRVTGIDLTAEFCDVARELTRATGLEAKVDFVDGDALAMPFADARFDGAYSMYVSMNIADRAALYREIHRVVKPGGWLMLSEIAKGAGGDPDFPVPWAASGETSFLATPGATRSGLAAAGFDVVQWRSTREQALSSIARARAMTERGEKPPYRAVALIHGQIASTVMANTARALADGRIDPIELLATRRR